MNVLITTLSLLLVLGVGAGIFWKEALSTSFSLKAVKGMYEAKRIARNQLEQKNFASFKEPHQTPQKEKKKGVRTATFQSHRLSNPPIEQGRFGIAALQENENLSHLKPIVQRLFVELYGHTDWFDPTVCMRLIDKFASCQGEFDDQSFAKDLAGEEYRIWYLMCKGTQTYDVENKIGYPPLTDFIDFKPRPLKQTCHFPFASLPLLKALLGRDLAAEILKIEKKKWEKDHRRRFCLKKELLTLVATKSHPELVQIVETYCDFHQSVGKKSFVVGQEENSGIVIRKRADAS